MWLHCRVEAQLYWKGKKFSNGVCRVIWLAQQTNQHIRFRVWHHYFFSRFSHYGWLTSSGVSSAYLTCKKSLMYWCTFLKCVKLNKVCFPPLFVLFITKGKNDRSMQFGSRIRKLQIYSLQPHIFQLYPTPNLKSKMPWHKHAFLHLFQWSLQQLAWDHWKLFCILPW